MQELDSSSSYYQLNTASGLVVAIFLFIAGVVIVRLSHHKETMNEQLKLFVVAYLARMAMIMVIYNGGLISIVSDADSHGWVHSLEICERWRLEGYGILTVPIAVFEDLQARGSQISSHILYKLAYAALFLITGLPGRIAAASLNALFGALIPVFSYRMSIQIFGDLKAARYLGWTLALMPSMLVFSALTAKEPFVVFFEVLGLYCCVQIAQRKIRLRYLFAFAMSTYCMFYLRFYIYNVLIGSIVAAVIVPIFIRGRFRKAALISGAIASPVVMYFGYVSAMAERQEDATRNARALQGLKTYSAAMGGKSFVQNPFDVTQPSQFVPGLLFGLAHLLFAPFPWNLARGSSLMLMTSPEVLWWYYVGSVRLIRGLRYGLRENLADSLIPILFCLPLLYYYSLIFSNIGLAYRYRAQIYPELLLFIGFGYKRLRTMHGFNSYALPEPDEHEEYVPENLPAGHRQPWIVRERFDRDPGYQPTQWPNRNDRFRRM